MKTSSNGEAAIILVSTVSSALTGALSVMPIPLEFKAPIVTCLGTITVGIIAYWRTKVNEE